VASAAQIRHIWGLGRELNMDKDMIYQVMFNMTAQEHMSAMTTKEANTVIDELKRYAGKGDTPGMITQAQVQKIRALEYELGWHDEPKRLAGFIKKYTHVDRMMWLKVYQASNVIEAMKKVIDRENEKGNGHKDEIL